MSKSVAVASWESTDFPNACENCLGANPYVRMTKEHYGRDCKVCLKPFTIFRWCPGPKMRFRRTEICSTCAKLKNLCQSCMLDLQYGLPAQVRDKVLGVTENVPKNEANREYFIASKKARLERGDTSLVDYDKVGTSQARAVLEKLARKSPSYERNLAPPCSFFAKGKCTRGDTCPYRHALVAERYPSLQSYRDRYYGENDPVAKNMLGDNEDVLKLVETNQQHRDKRLNKVLILIGPVDEVTKEGITGFFSNYFPVVDLEIKEKDGLAKVHFPPQIDLNVMHSQFGGGKKIVIDKTEFTIASDTGKITVEE